MHWGTVILSLEPIMEPPARFKMNATRFGFKEKTQYQDWTSFKLSDIQINLTSFIFSVYHC